MDLLEFFTGHSSDEASVYENQDKVDLVVGKLTDLGNKSIPAFTENIVSAVNNYNSVNGVGTYISDLDPEYFTTMMDEIGSGVTTISTKISGAAEDIKTYNESSTLEKIGSSAAMLGCKIGEGFLSVFEGIGDAVVSLAGWIAPKGSDFEKACEDIVKTQWSHDAFNFYYNSDFAKKSAFTEDSAIAGIGKIAGTVAAFVVPGMAFSAVAGAIGEGASAAIGIANTIANSSKIINVVSAGMIGMGSATEAGLLAGKSMDDAALAGAGAGLLSAGLAFGISTAAEKIGSVLGKGAGAADDVLNQTDEMLGQAGKGAGVIDDALNQTDEVLEQAGKGAGIIDDALNQTDDTVATVERGFHPVEEGPQYRNTSIREKSAYTAESGRTYELSSTIKGDKVEGAYKHMSDEVRLSTTAVHDVDNAEAVKTLRRATELSGDNKFASAANNIEKQNLPIAAEGKGKTLKKINDALDVIRAESPEEFEAMQLATKPRLVNPSRIQTLESQSGIKFESPELLSKTTPLTQSEVRTIEDYAERASQQIYSNALENYDRGIIIAGGKPTTVSENLTGIPVVVDGAAEGSSTPYYIEILANPSRTEGTSARIYHMFNQPSTTTGVTVPQAAQNQVGYGFTQRISGKVNILDDIISDTSSTPALERIATQVKDDIISSEGYLHIEEPWVQEQISTHIDNLVATHSQAFEDRLSELVAKMADSQATTEEIATIRKSLIEMLTS